MLYLVERYVPNVWERYSELVETRVVGSRRAAELLASSWLPVVSETEYSARVTRHASVMIRQTKDNRVGRQNEYCHGLKCWRVETPIRYVPSVGDLGWTP